MKNNIKKLTLLFVAVLVSFTACNTVDFGDTNVNIITRHQRYLQMII